MAANLDEIRKAVKEIELSLARLRDALGEGTAKPPKRDALAMIVEALASGPKRDYVLVEELGPRVTWGMKGAEIWKSLAEHAPRRERITCVDESGSPVRFVKERTLKMKRNPKSLKDSYPGNLIALVKD